VFTWSTPCRVEQRDIAISKGKDRVEIAHGGAPSAGIAATMTRSAAPLAGKRRPGGHLARRFQDITDEHGLVNRSAWRRHLASVARHGPGSDRYRHDLCRQSPAEQMAVWWLNIVPGR
jgi:hypothetical protein